jgi:poly(A) polymerase
LTQNDAGGPVSDDRRRSRPVWATAALVERIFTETRRLEGEARIVGGAVRDWCSGAPVGDIDMAVNLPIERFAGHFDAIGVKVVETGLKFGTVTLIDGDTAIEVTQTRIDVETDGRHATVAHSTDWTADAMRRDFTVNALYLDAEGRVHDPLGGLADLRAGRLRFAGEADLRVREDALRMLRYCRFLPRFIKGGIDPEARRALTAHAALCQRLSGERVAHEMRRILVGAQLGMVVRLMHETELDVYAVGVPLDAARLGDLEPMEEPIFANMGWLAGLAVLMPSGAAETVARRLRLGRAESRLLSDIDRDISPSELDALNGGGWQKLAYFMGPNLPVRFAVQSFRQGRLPDDSLLEVLRDWRRPVFPLRGADLLSHGVDNGPGVGQMLEQAERRWVASGFSLGKAALLSWLIGD